MLEHTKRQVFEWKFLQHALCRYVYNRSLFDIFSLPFAKLSSFQSLISRKQLREIELQMVSAISFDWFADFGKTLIIIQRSSQPVYSDKW